MFDWLPLVRDGLALFRAASVLPEFTDRTAVAAYLATLNDPAAGIIAAVAAKIQNRAAPGAVPGDAELEALVAAACKDVDPKGWMELLPLILPLVKLLFERWLKRRHATPTPTPAPVV